MSPHWFVGGCKTARSYTDALGEPLREPLDDPMLDAAGGQSDRVRNRFSTRVAVGYHGQAAQAEQVRAAVGVGVEAGMQPPRGAPDQQAAELPRRGRGDLLAQSVEELQNRSLEQLEGDVAGEPVRDDDVGRPTEQVAALGVPGEVEPVVLAQEPVR